MKRISILWSRGRDERRLGLLLTFCECCPDESTYSDECPNHRTLIVTLAFWRWQMTTSVLLWKLCKLP